MKLPLNVAEQEKAEEEHDPATWSFATTVLPVLKDRFVRFMFAIMMLLVFSVRWYGVIWLSLTVATRFLRDGGGHGSSATLLPFAFKPLPLGSVKPAGWLRNEMQHYADGLAGHLHEFYRYVYQSPWLGGTHEYSRLNEGFPYWFNGLVPLAYGLDNDRLKFTVAAAVHQVLSRQHHDGWIGPETGRARNIWARFPFLLGLINLAEADASLRTDILDAVHKFNELLNKMLNNNYQGYHYHEGDEVGSFDTSWGRVRMCDMLIVLQWMLEHDPRDASPIITENMGLLINGSLDWSSWYQEGVYIKEDLSTLPAWRTSNNYWFQHGVNIGQGLKAGAVVRRLTKNNSLLQDVSHAFDWTQKYHGAPSGVVLADERLQGLTPYYGSELCTVVETMFSLSYLHQSLGNAKYADAAELVTFNALPAMLSADHWSHQYVAQPNQPFCENLAEGNPFYNVNQWGQTFGLEPNYPCCTVNHFQGLPKYVAAMFATVGVNGSDGLAHTLLGPASVNTTLAGGNEVRVNCSTDYPFGSLLTYSISAKSAFNFYIRVPKWTNSGKVSFVSGARGSVPVPIEVNDATRMQKISVPAGHSKLIYSLPAQISIEPRENDTVAVRHSSLLYALELGYFNTSTQSPIPGDLPEQARDYQIFNTTPWNIAIDTSTLQYTGGASGGSLADPIFAPGAPPGKITVKGCEIDWPLYQSVVGPAPPKLYRTCIAKPQTYTLRPYGSTKIRMAELPVIDLSADSGT